MQVYKKWFAWLMEKQKPQVDLIVYLQTTPQTCMDRLKQRGRSEECDVPVDYLEALHARYEDWLIDHPEQHFMDVPVLVRVSSLSLSHPEQRFMVRHCLSSSVRAASSKEAFDGSASVRTCRVVLTLFCIVLCLFSPLTPPPLLFALSFALQVLDGNQIATATNGVADEFVAAIEVRFFCSHLIHFLLPLPASSSTYMANLWLQSSFVLSRPC
jgi:hypothetical protein